MADLAALRRSDATCFAGCIRRHVVVEHEAIAVFAHQRVDDLLVACGAERCHDERLRLAARKQRGAVRSWQYARTNRDRSHRTRVATIDARLAGENLLADNFCFQIEKHVAYVAAELRRGIGRHAGGLNLRFDFRETLLARLLGADPIRFVQFAFRNAGNLTDQRFVLRRRLPSPQRLAGLFYQLMNDLDHRLHLLVAVDDGAQHHFFRKFVCLRLDHQHRRFGAGNDEVEL